MYPKNAASPEPIAIGAVAQISDGAVQTSGVTVRIKPVGVAEADGAGTVSYSTDGIVIYTPTQAETNYTSFIVIAKKTGCHPVSQTIITTNSSVPGTVCLSPSQGPVTFTGAAASGATPATSGLTLVGGAASTTSGGTAAPGLTSTGGAGAASMNGAQAGGLFVGGASGGVSSSGPAGIRFQGTDLGAGMQATSANRNAINCNPGTNYNAIGGGNFNGNLIGSVGTITTPPDVYVQATSPINSHTSTTVQFDPNTFGVDNYARGMSIRCVSGTGIGQERTIVSYIDSTGTMTIDRAWDVTPAAFDGFDIVWGNNLRLNSTLDPTTLSAATANKIADHVRRRTQANVEASADGDALSKGSEYGFIQQAQESNTTAHAGKLTIFKTDGTTELGQITIAVDADAEPITGAS